MHHLRQLALGVFARHHVQRLAFDLCPLAFAAKLQVTPFANRFGGSRGGP